MNKNEITVKEENYLTELKNTKELCEQLTKTPHYAKIGQEGIFAIVTTAKSLNLNPVQALMGGMYYVKGKVEMSSRMMAALIRSKKHSITRDSKSNDKVCILHGKRADNKDCWTESFSIEEARKAGLIRAHTPWITYPKDMLYARALSRLARQLFPDIIGNCYVQGEIGDDPNIIQNDNQCEHEEIEISDIRTAEEIKTLLEILKHIPEDREKLEEFLQEKGIYEFKDMPKALYDKVLKKAQINAYGKLKPEIRDEDSFYHDVYFEEEDESAKV